MHNLAPDYTILLAAGRGTRMGGGDCPKVCFPVNGIPAINRALTAYSGCGIRQHVIVVGAHADKVIESVGAEFDNVLYVYQREPLGTAHALRCACRSLVDLPDEAVLLLVAGDRIIAPATLERLFDLYRSSRAQVALLALRCPPKSSQGRIIVDSSGHPLAILEMADIRQRRAIGRLRERVLQEAVCQRQDLLELLQQSFFGADRAVDAGKGAKAFGALWECLNQPDAAVLPRELLLPLLPEALTRFELSSGTGSLTVTPDAAEAARYGNTSVYVLQARVLKQALAALSRDNAQREEYLSDLPALVRSSYGAGSVRMLAVDDAEKVLGFNNPAELLEVERILRDHSLAGTRWRLDPEHFQPLRQWRQTLLDGHGASRPEPLRQIYGHDVEICRRQSDLYRVLLEQAEAVLPDAAECGLVRVPGRLNVMGRHVDHQGGNCNLMTISFETVMLVSPRADDRIVLRHCDPERFGDRDFSIGELVASLPWENWQNLVASDALMKRFREYGVDWSEYVKAAVLRLQMKFSTCPLRGLTLVVNGNIPLAAGLSSSSSLIVGAAEAAVAVNNLDVFPSQLVNICGEGEWFVGTRGGSADHAAVKMGCQDSVIKVRFFDFAVEEVVPFPEEYAMVVCDSGIQAKKSSEAKDQFNHRISCYRLGLALIRQHFPQYAGVLRHLRDVNVRTLQVPLAQIYRMLLMLPEQATLPELQKRLPGIDVVALCAGHRPPADGLYPVRGVVLFGLSECERSRTYAGCLRRGDMAEIGRMMRVSHDGDRVCSFGENWEPLPFHAPVDNMYLLERLADLESGLPERVVRAQLLWQSGAYACSLPEIDRMVDIAGRTEGVAGAQLAGAGLGGCMMVLCRKEAIATLQKNLEDNYYQPADRVPAILVCRPVPGGGLIPVAAAGAASLHGEKA